MNECGTDLLPLPFPEGKSCTLTGNCSIWLRQLFILCTSASRGRFSAGSIRASCPGICCSHNAEDTEFSQSGQNYANQDTEFSQSGHRVTPIRTRNSANQDTEFSQSGHRITPIRTQNYANQEHTHFWVRTYYNMQMKSIYMCLCDCWIINTCIRLVRTCMQARHHLHPKAPITAPSFG